MREVVRTDGFYFEEAIVGLKFKTRARTITETDLVSFCNLTWMTESLFVDHEQPRVGAASGGFVVPAALVYGMAEGLLTHTMEHTGMAFLHADFKVSGPTNVGDTIHVAVEVIEARPTSKPGRGLVRTRNRVLKSSGEECIVYEPLRMLRGKQQA